MQVALYKQVVRCGRAKLSLSDLGGCA